MSYSRVTTITGAFLRRALRNRWEVTFTIVVPLLIAFVFGLADERGTQSLPVGVVNQSGGALSATLVDNIGGEATLRVRDFDDVDGMEAALRRGEIYAGVAIPEDYDTAIEAGGPAVVDIIGDRAQSATVAASAGVVLVVDRENQAIQVARGLAADSGDDVPAAIPEAREIVAATPVEVEHVVASKTTRATGLGRATAGMLVYFLFQNGLSQSVLLLDDRRRGVVARMVTTPTSDREIVAGEMIGRFVLIAFQGFIIVAAGALLFGVQWGNLFAVAAVIALFALVSTTMSLVVGCKRSTEDSTFAGVGVAAVAGLLGGCFFALVLVPDWLRTIGHATPHAWAVDALSQLVSTDSGISAILRPLLVLAGLTALFFALAVRRFRRAFES